MNNDYLLELHIRVTKAGLLKPLSSLMYYLGTILKRFTLEEIKKLKEIIELNIVSHYEKELADKIDELKELREYDGHYNEYGEWESDYNKYFFPASNGEYYADKIYILQDFDVPTRWANEDYESLAWILETDEFFFDDILALDFEIMAVQSIIYIEDFIAEPNEITYLSNAFLAFREAEKMVSELEHKGALLAAAARAKKRAMEKANEARHQESKKMKSLVIQRWNNYKKSKAEQGKKASKTAFAEKIFNELDKAHKKNPEANKSFSFKTIRNNWLQGVP